MKKIIEKFGMDKVAHFGVGGLIAAIVSIIIIAQDLPVFVAEPWRLLFLPLAGAIVTGFLSVIKELIIDGETDWKDVYAGLIGSGAVCLAVWVGYVLFTLSN